MCRHAIDKPKNNISALCTLPHNVRHAKEERSAIPQERVIHKKAADATKLSQDDGHVADGSSRPDQLFSILAATTVEPPQVEAPLAFWRVALLLFCAP